MDYKVDNMTQYKQWSLERACVKECDPFCVSMGGRTKVRRVGLPFKLTSKKVGLVNRVIVFWIFYFHF